MSKRLGASSATAAFFERHFVQRWRRHIALVKDILFLFSKKKDFLALNTRNFNVRHFYCLLFRPVKMGVVKRVYHKQRNYLQ